MVMNCLGNAGSLWEVGVTEVGKRFGGRIV